MIWKLLLVTLILGGTAALLAFCGIRMEKEEEGKNHVREAETQGAEPENGGKAAAGGAVLPERRRQEEGGEIRTWRNR